MYLEVEVDYSLGFDWVLGRFVWGRFYPPTASFYSLNTIYLFQKMKLEKWNHKLIKIVVVIMCIKLNVRLQWQKTMFQFLNIFEIETDIQLNLPYPKNVIRIYLFYWVIELKKLTTTTPIFGLSKIGKLYASPHPNNCRWSIPNLSSNLPLLGDIFPVRKFQLIYWNLLLLRICKLSVFRYYSSCFFDSH